MYVSFSNKGRGGEAEKGDALRAPQDCFRPLDSFVHIVKHSHLGCVSITCIEEHDHTWLSQLPNTHRYKFLVSILSAAGCSKG